MPRALLLSGLLALALAPCGAQAQTQAHAALLQSSLQSTTQLLASRSAAWKTRTGARYTFSHGSERTTQERTTATPPTLQNILLWFGQGGTPSGNLPFTFAPQNLTPSFLKPMYGWFSQMNFQSCLFGTTVKLGPYGTASIGVSASRGCT